MGSVVKPITAFEKTLTRAFALLDHADGGLPTPEDNDFRRAAVILSIAAFDRYFTSKFCDTLIDYLRSGQPVTDRLEKLLLASGLNTKFALELAISKRPFRKIRTIVQNHLSFKTTQRADAINQLFRDLGFSDLCGKAEKSTKRTTVVKRTMKLVDLRNDISHEGHVDRAGNPKSINAADIRSRINDMKLLVEKCDEILDEKFGPKSPVST